MRVLSKTTSVPPTFEIPPPENARPPVTVACSSVRIPTLLMLPPKNPVKSVARPSAIVTCLMATVAVGEVMSNTRSRPPFASVSCRITVSRAEAPLMLSALPELITSAPKLPSSR